METLCWMACYELILKETEQFVLSCHNFDCENSMADAWLAASKNSVRINILEPPSCAYCDQQLLHIFKKSCKLVTYTNWQWGGCIWTPHICTCTCSHWLAWGLAILADSILFSVNSILEGLWLNCISSVEITLFLLTDISLQHRALFQY